MKMPCFRSALTACWRVFSLLMLMIMGALALLYAYMPNLKQVQPEVEALLQQELGLSSLKLGDVSWSWGWHPAIQLEHAAFHVTPNMSLQDATVRLDISLLALLQGSFRPLHLWVSQGKAEVQFPLPETKQSALPVTVIPIDIQQVQVTWAWQGETGHVALHTLRVLPALREIRVDSDVVQGKLVWNRAGGVDAVSMNIPNIHALSKQLATYVHGPLGAMLKVQRTVRDEAVVWEGHWALHHMQATSFHVQDIQLHIPVDDMKGRFEVHTSPEGHLLSWQLSPVWQWKSNRAQAHLDWKEGRMTLAASSSLVSMPLVWSWLNAVDESEAWVSWLKVMKQGEAKHVSVMMQVPWQQWNALPTETAWNALRYQIQADVQGMDVSLGESGVLQHIRGHISINEQGLHATVQTAKLPEQAGEVQGKVDADWQHGLLKVQGKGVVSIQALQQWVGEKGEVLRWKNAAQAKTRFALQWAFGEESLHKLQVQLTPEQPWKAQLYQQTVTVSAGQVVWDMHRGVTAKNLVFQSELMKGTVSFAAKQISQRWQLESLDGALKGSLGEWMQYYQLPVAQVQGTWLADVQMRQQVWSGSVSLKQAEWENILGSSKSLAEPMSLVFQGVSSKQGFYLQSLQSLSPLLQLEAHGDVTEKQWLLIADKLKTAEMDVKVHAIVPVDGGIWRMTVDGAYLNRRALPHHIEAHTGMVTRPWQLSADIQRVRWNKTDIQQVKLDVSSQLGYLAHIHAAEMTSKALSLQNMEADFVLLGGGKLDIRQLSASMGVNHLWLTGMLSPELSDGMKWQGFVRLSGLLGDMMVKAGLPQLFRSGHMQALLAGEAHILRDEPWWKGFKGRLRLHAKDGEILKGGTLTKLLAAISWADLPKILVGWRPDLTREGLVYEHLLLEGDIQGQDLHIQRMGLRSSAFQMSGQGLLNLDNGRVDVMAVVQPFQNLDAILSKIPLLRDILGGRARSLFRKAYHVYGPLTDAAVDSVSPEVAGAPSSGLIDRLLNLPDAWFGERPKVLKGQP